MSSGMSVGMSSGMSDGMMPIGTAGGRVPALALEQLAVRFGARVGLPAVSFQVARGERLALLGPSGAGKSSLLRTMAGLDAAAGGEVTVAGQVVTHRAAHERRVVYLHQSPLLFLHLTVLDNVAFPLQVRGVARGEARERAAALLAHVQLAALAARAPASLSGGEQHRVALARALAADPAVLLLDEPFAALDPSLRAEVRDAVGAVLASRALAAILVTHDVDEAAAFADRMGVLQDGGIVQLADPGEVLRQPATEGVARFLGLPNLLAGERDDEGWFRCAVGVVRAPDAPREGWLVAPPDALVLDRNGAASVGVVVRREERVSGTWVHVRDGAGTSSFVGVARAGVALAVGDAVSVAVDWERTHIVARRQGEGGRV